MDSSSHRLAYKHFGCIANYTAFTSFWGLKAQFPILFAFVFPSSSISSKVSAQELNFSHLNPSPSIDRKIQESAPCPLLHIFWACSSLISNEPTEPTRWRKTLSAFSVGSAAKRMLSPFISIISFLPFTLRRNLVKKTPRLETPVSLLRIRSEESESFL